MSGRGGGRGRGKKKKWGDTGFEAWGGYMSAKTSKLEQQFSEDAALAAAAAGNNKDDKNAGLFKDVAIFVNGYTDPSGDELKRIMMVHGGTFHHYFNPRKTTHIIAINLPDSKVKALKGDEPICHPRWITESLAQGKLLDYRNFLLYTCQTTSQPKLKFQPVAPPSTSSSTSPSKAALDAKDSRFLGEFYNNSRLHHISTMGANFKRYVNELREKRGDDSLFPKRATLAPTTGFLIEPFAGSKKATILHIDMDCFFVSVGLRKHPELRGKPVAVAHARGVKPVSAETAELRRKEMELYRGRHSKNSSEPPSNLSSVEFASMSELASVSYEARAAGVKNGMFLGGAMKLCPEIKTIPYDFEGYNEVAYSLYDTVAEYTLDIQAVSCDEMLVDITELVQECRISPLDFAQALRDEIFAKTKCKASVGIGPNLLLARMATRKAKPDGKFHLTEEQAPEFMKQVPVRDLPGVGRKMEAKLRDLGIQTCEELQGISLARLKAEFGAKTGLQMSQFARGEDDRALNICQERKSVSAEVNYGIRFETRADSDKFIAQLCGEVHSRLEKLGVRGKCITLKFMMRSSDAPKETSKHLGHGICDNISKSRVLANPTCDLAVIKREVGHLLQEMKLDHSDMRGLGIQISKLDGNTKGVAAGTSRASTSRGGGGGGGASILSFVQKINPPPKKKMKAETTVPPPIPSTSAAAAAAAESDLTDVSSSSHRQSDLSFSQLDPEVMDALPEDIRREVLEGLEHSKKKPESSGCNKVSQDMLSNRASTSVAGAEATASGQDISSAGAELSFSQLDPEFLAALPPDLVAEVKQQYTKPTTRQQQRQTVTAFDRMMEKKPPPASATTSPVTSRKRGRGRPPKNSPRFIKKSSNRSNPNSPAKKRPVSRALFDPPKAAAAEERTPAAATSSAPAPAVVEVREPANIEGRREPSEVRKLLKAWMESTENPTEDDVATFAKFLQELIEEKAIDIVSVILKSFCRFLGTKKQKAEHWWDSSWKAAYEKIEEHVQLSMIANYEYKMFTDFKI